MSCFYSPIHCNRQLFVIILNTQERPLSTRTFPTAARPPACQGEAVGQGLTLLTGFLLARRQHWEGNLSITAILSPAKPGPYFFPGTKWSLLGRGKSYPEDTQEKKVLTHQTIYPISPLSSQSGCIIFCCSHYKHFLNGMGSMSLKSHA